MKILRLYLLSFVRKGGNCEKEGIKKLFLTRAHGSMASVTPVRFSALFNKGAIIKSTGSWSRRKTYERTYHERYIFELRNKDEFSWQQARVGSRLPVLDYRPIFDLPIVEEDSHRGRGRDARRLVKWSG